MHESCMCVFSFNGQLYISKFRFYKMEGTYSITDLSEGDYADHEKVMTFLNTMAALINCLLMMSIAVVSSSDRRTKRCFDWELGK